MNVATPKTTTNTTTSPRVPDPRPKQPVKNAPAKKPTKKAAAPKSGAKQKPVATTGDPRLDALLQAIGGSDGFTGDVDALYSEAESTVRPYEVYVGADYGFRSTKTGAVRTKVKASELLDSLRTMSDARYRQLQEKLFRGGFYGTANRKAVAFGARNDTDTRDALARAVARNVVANRTTTRTTRLTLGDILDDAERNAPAALLEGEDSDRAPFAFQPMDPKAIKDAVNAAMPDIIGRALSPDETDRLVAEFQAKQYAAARSVYDVEGSGGTAMPKPDFEAFVRGRAEEWHPDEAKAKQMANLSKQFLAGIQSGAVDRVF